MEISIWPSSLYNLSYNQSIQAYVQNVKGNMWFYVFSFQMISPTMYDMMQEQNIPRKLIDVTSCDIIWYRVLKGFTFTHYL